MPLTLAQVGQINAKTNRREGRSSAFLKFTRFYRGQRGHAHFVQNQGNVIVKVKESRVAIKRNGRKIMI